MTNRPLVSIGMPVYNGERFIGDAIESVLAQTYSNLEILICDNYSTDRTEEICHKYAASDDRVRYYRYTNHIGVIKNFLRVLDLATGDFFMWACADDIRPAGSVEDLMSAMLRSPHAVMVHGQIDVTAKQSRKLFENRINLMKENSSERVRELVKGFEHNSMVYGIYKTKILKRAVFPSHYGNDFLLCLQMCLFGPVEYSAATMLVYREKTLHPHFDPMGPEKKVTLRNVLTLGKAIFKAWMTFLYGYWYLLRPSAVSLSKRVVCLYAFGSAFVRRYHGRLVRDAILIVTLPIGWLVSWTWSLARRSSIGLVLGRKVKGRIISP